MYRITEKPFDYYLRYREIYQNSPASKQMIQNNQELYQSLESHRNIVKVESMHMEKGNFCITQPFGSARMRSPSTAWPNTTTTPLKTPSPTKETQIRCSKMRICCISCSAWWMSAWEFPSNAARSTLAYSKHTKYTSALKASLKYTPSNCTRRLGAHWSAVLTSLIRTKGHHSKNPCPITATSKATSRTSASWWPNWSSSSSKVSWNPCRRSTFALGWTNWWQGRYRPVSDSWRCDWSGDRKWAGVGWRSSWRKSDWRKA